MAVEIFPRIGKRLPAPPVALSRTAAVDKIVPNVPPANELAPVPKLGEVPAE